VIICGSPRACHSRARLHWSCVHKCILRLALKPTAHCVALMHTSKQSYTPFTTLNDTIWLKPDSLSNSARRFIVAWVFFQTVSLQSITTSQWETQGNIHIWHHCRKLTADTQRKHQAVAFQTGTVDTRPHSSLLAF